MSNITGDSNGNSLQGSSGNDTIQGLGGNDTIDGQAGSDSLLGGDGDDRIEGNFGNDSLYGGNGNDTLTDDQGSNLLDGGAGSDNLTSRSLSGQHTLLGGTGNDTLNATGQTVSLDGGDQDDSLSATGQLYQSGSSSYVSGGNATLLGGTGTDNLSVSYYSNASLDGGEGNDWLDVSQTRSATLQGGTGEDSLSVNFSGYASNQTDGDSSLPENYELDGGDDNDTLTVSGSSYVYYGQTTVSLRGGAGNDTLRVTDNYAGDTGTEGDRRGIAQATLDGGAGDDRLEAGGVLQLTLTGGTGIDTFVLTAQQYRTLLEGTRSFYSGGSLSMGTATNVTADPITITDFAAGAGGDVLDYSDLLRNGTLSYDGSNPFGTGFLKLQQSGSDTLLSFDADGQSGAQGSAVVIARLKNVSASSLIAANFNPNFDLPASGGGGSTPIVNRPPTGSVTITGVATQGQSLTAGNTLADLDGLGVITYQWQADGTDISGATSNNLTLTQAQVGKAITVKASYTDGKGTAESLTSTATAKVANVNDAPTASNRAVSFNEDTSKTFALADFGFSDVDAANSLQSITVTTLETLGALKHNGVDVTLNQVISAADITAGKLTYTPLANGNGAGYASFGFKVSDGLLSSASAYTMALNVAAINDAPTASNRAVTFNEDTSKTFALADFGFSDVDAGNSLQSVTVTTLEALGALKLNGVDVTLNQVISAADITAGKLSYTPVANGNGATYASFGFKVSDGLLSSASAYTMALNVAAVNDAPTASNRAVSFNEDTSKTFALADFGFSDVDAGNSLQSVTVTTLEALGALKLNGVDVTLNQVIGAADITAGKLTYTPLANGNGAGYASFGFKVSDGSLSSASAYTMALNVTPVNDAPTASNRAVSFNEDTSKTFALADFGFGDVDAGNSLQSVTVTTLETLGALKHNGVDVTLNQVISAADITAGKLTYTPLANGNGASYASFGFKVSDGLLSSTSAYTMALNVAAVNDAPTASNRAVSFNEDTSKTFALADFGFSDIDAGNSLQSVTVTTLEALGALKLNGVDVTLNQVISAADITAGKLIYSPVANGNGASYASFGFKVSDGLLSSASAYTMALNVAAVNDAPTASNRAVSFNEDTSKTFALADFGFSDIDAGNSLQSVTVTTLEALGALKLNGVDVTLNQVISAADITAGKLSYTPVANGNGATYASFGFKVSDGLLSSASAYTMALNVAAVNDALTGSVTLSGTAKQGQILTASNTLADVDGLGTIAYQWLADGVAIAGATAKTLALGQAQVGKAISVKAGYTDLQGTAESKTSSVTAVVANVNDAPTASNRSVSFNEDTSKTFALADFGFSDIDAGNSLQSVTVTTLETLGALKHNGVDVTLNQVISAADITAGKLTYTPLTNGNGAGYASFGFKVSDGLLSSASAYTMALNVAAVNDAPTASNRAVSFNEDTSKTFALADFGFSDVDAGNSLQSVTVTTLEALGALKLNGVDVTLNQVIGAADITAGKLTYTPLANGNGAGYASFGFKVSDGSLSSASAYTMALNVTAVNDAPTASNRSVTFNEDTSKTFALADFGFSDVDAGNSLQSVTVTTLEALGALKHNGVDVTLNQVISAADITAGKLSYTPVANGNGAGYASFGFKVSDGSLSSASAYTMALNVAAVNDALTGSVTLSGTAKQGQILTASNTLADVDGLGTIAYQWLADGVAIAGATAKTLTLGQAQVGKILSVKASYIDGKGTAESRTSSTTAKVANVNDAGTVTVSGTATQSQVLTATVADADGLPTTGVTYQWLADGVTIAGATAKTLTLGQAQVGKAISVKAGYTDLLGTAESRISSATTKVVNVNDVGTVTVSGKATQGQVLTATVVDVDGVPTTGVTYQWLADSVAIAGATAKTVTLTQAAAGHAISVVTSYQDLQGTQESITSTPTALVGGLYQGGSGLDTINGSAGNDTIYGGEGRDILLGGDGNDYIDAGASAPFNISVAYNDWISGGAGNDTLLGGAGADWFAIEAGDDSIDGGIVTDRANNSDNNGIRYEGSADLTVDLRGITGDGSIGVGRVTSSDGSVGVDTVANINRVTTGAGNDRLLGSSAMILEVFDAGLGDDTIDGGAVDPVTHANNNRAAYGSAVGSVTVDLKAGTASGGGGNDQLSNITQVLGSSYNDTLYGSDTTTLAEGFEGGRGDDVIDGRGGFDIARYFNGGEVDSGIGVNVNLVTGIATGYNVGTDKLLNIEGVFGSNFNDTLTGGNTANGANYQADQLKKEVFQGGFGDDTIDGGVGFDRADYTIAVSGIVATLKMDAAGTVTGVVSDGLGWIDILRNIEGIRGSDFDDLLRGSNRDSYASDGYFEFFEGRAGDDVIDGRGGMDFADYLSTPGSINVNLAAGSADDGHGTSDTLLNIEGIRGSAFSDMIVGDAKANTLLGHGGADTLTGGAGSDKFVFTGLNDLGLGAGQRDVITDFKSAEGDKLDLSLIDANAALAADQAFSWVTGFTTTTGQARFAADGKGNGIVYLNTDTDLDAEFEILLTGVTTLASADVIL